MMRAAVAFVAVSAPMALGMESLLRKLLFPPEFEEMREFLQPGATTLAWAAVFATGAAALLAWVLAKRWIPPRLEEAIPTGDEKAIRRAFIDKLMIAASIPQVPAIGATMCFMVGASLEPVLVSMAISTLAIVGLGVATERWFKGILARSEGAAAS